MYWRRSIFTTLRDADISNIWGEKGLRPVSLGGTFEGARDENFEGEGPVGGDPPGIL